MRKQESLQLGENRNITAYTIKDKFFGVLKVQKSANAWWMDRVKLNSLITSFKYGVNIKEACILAGISEDQYKYFKGLHPEFSSIVETCRKLPGLRARKAIIEALDTDLVTARWYLERKYPDEFGKVKNTESVISSSIGTMIARTREKYSI